MKSKTKSIDGNTAAAHIAYAFSEVAAIYPITPSSTMGELADAWANQGRKNLFGLPVSVVEMQSEAGAAGALHGILSAGGLGSTFTASQGLLLMIPNMYKIAGELMPCVFHVSARAIAAQALSIFGDHQDVMATRATGFCLLCSNSVQEAMDLALVAHLSSLTASLPFVHFFDGFRTSHEIQKVQVIDYEDIKPLVDMKEIEQHRNRALNPEHPHLRGTAQNPDIYFQLTEAGNSYYLRVPEIVQGKMDQVGKLTGRQYHLFDYVGASDAEKVIVMMGSGAETAEETIKDLCAKGEKVGLLKVRLYRPFSEKHFLNALPLSVKKIAVLDRTKENGSLGEPLYLDVATAFQEEKRDVLVVGGRYGLGSKEFTPTMVKTVFDHLNTEECKNHFTIGITDDVTYTSLPLVPKIYTEPKNRVKCKFWGLGGDGTVGANKEAIKIIGDHTEKFVQGYFAYDSKKSGGLTVSHLRFGDDPILSTYLIDEADYIACHNAAYVHKYDLLEGLKEGGTFVLNSAWNLEDMETHLPNSLKKEIAQKKIQFYNINAVAIAREVGLGGRINMVMQTAFFKLANILPVDVAVKLLKEAIVKAYKSKGDAVVEMNQKAVDLALNQLEKIAYPSSWATSVVEKESEDPLRPAFIRDVADKMNRLKGDDLPVSAFTPGGIFPLETTVYEKRGVASQIPEWVPENCIQCTQCSFVCPHAAVRPFLLTEEEKAKLPPGYKGVTAKGKGFESFSYSIEISPLDCTGCGNCIQVCPGMAGKKALVLDGTPDSASERKTLWDAMVKIPSKETPLNKFTVKGSQLKKPLLEFSGACAGCGETPYVKLLTQLFGERMIISNATGCSSIWGGSAPSIPWALSETGCGPAWANSLFEDNAEYGFGMTLASEYRRNALAQLVATAIDEEKDPALQEAFKEWIAHKDEGELTTKLSFVIKGLLEPKTRTPIQEEIWKRKDQLVKPSIWLFGGDGWAYDIDFGGLDHVIAMGKDVNIFVMDTEVYSNTGGQSSKATPLGAIAKFASAGKRTMKKELGLMAMTYGHVYVASVSMGADKQQVVKAMKEAEEYPGPSIIIAYASCINHGIVDGMRDSQKEEKRAVDSGYWINYRYDPRKEEQPFQLDSKDPTLDIHEFLGGQARYNYLRKTYPDEAEKLEEELGAALIKRFARFKAMSVKAPTLEG